LQTFVFNSQPGYTEGWTKTKGYLNWPEAGTVAGTGHNNHDLFTEIKKAGMVERHYWQKEFYSKNTQGKREDFPWEGVGDSVNSFTMSGNCYGVTLWHYTGTETTSKAYTHFTSASNLDWNIEQRVGRITIMAATGTVAGVRTNWLKCKAAAEAVGLKMKPHKNYPPAKTWGCYGYPNRVGEKKVAYFMDGTVEEMAADVVSSSGSKIRLHIGECEADIYEKCSATTLPRLGEIGKCATMDKCLSSGLTKKGVACVGGFSPKSKDGRRNSGKLGEYRKGDPLTLHGSWGECDAACGGYAGNIYRFYHVTTPASTNGEKCPHADDFEDYRSCTSKLCANNDAAGCYRHDVCKSGYCDGSSVSMGTCRAKVDCVGQYGDWGECDAACGRKSGNRYKAYRVTTPAQGGSECPFAHGAEDYKPCTSKLCANNDASGCWLDGVCESGYCHGPAGRWGTCQDRVDCKGHYEKKWSECDGYCTKDGTKRKDYIVTTAARGGSECPATKSQTCNTGKCKKGDKVHWCYYPNECSSGTCDSTTLNRGHCV
jgi:hypothetical protein